MTVPAHNGIYNKLANSSNSSTDVNGWTNPPWLLNEQYVPTKTWILKKNILNIKTYYAIVVLNTSTPNVSAIISSVSLSKSECINAT